MKSYTLISLFIILSFGVKGQTITAPPTINYISEHTWTVSHDTLKKSYLVSNENDSLFIIHGFVANVTEHHHKTPGREQNYDTVWFIETDEYFDVVKSSEYLLATKKRLPKNLSIWQSK